MHPFSPVGRKDALERMSSQELDLLVIGGGITGCGVARDGALRGLNVGLVEKEDFAYGTSSRSSKLVHGGLRYLAYGDFRMVREAALERKVLQRIAPHLVHPLPFLFPLYQGRGRAKWRLGMWLFDQLASHRGAERHRFLDPAAVLERLPALKEEGLLGGLQYWEFITDDARLTLENGLSAAEHGALVVNHAAVTGLLRQGGRLAGTVVEDRLTHARYEVRARVVVNATGPWAAETMALGEVAAPGRILPSKGIHLLFRAERLPVDGAAVLRSRSGFQGFAIRRWEYVYIGTTDEPHDGALDRPRADRAAFGRLLALAQECFPSADLTERDVVGTWAGLRPLIAEAGKSARDTSRHDQIWQSPEGLITVAGGKLTTYRPMAARVMEHVCSLLGMEPGPNRATGEIPLPGGRFGTDEAAVALAVTRAELIGRGVPARTAERIAWLYGGRARELLRFAESDPAWLEPLAPGVPALRGEVRLAVEQEMAATVADFLDRRSALLLFSDDHGMAASAETARIMAGLLRWSETEQAAQVAAYHSLAEGAN